MNEELSTCPKHTSANPEIREKIGYHFVKTRDFEKTVAISMSFMDELWNMMNSNKNFCMVLEYNAEAMNVKVNYYAGTLDENSVGNGASGVIDDSTHEAEKVENVKKCEKACEAKAEEEREIAADKIKMLADEIYQQCVEEKMSCHDFGLLAALINQHKVSAFSTVRCQIDERTLPSLN